MIDILLVEDSPGDIRLMREALRSTKVPNRLHTVTDGERAMAFMTRSGEYADAPRPDIVLLDLNLPRKNGSEVLREIKNDSDLCKIPVIVLSTSGNPDDVVMSYEAHANCYVRKPMEMSTFTEVITKIDEFWFTVAQLPRA